jgi:diamine N-acetyltransferase
MTIFKASKDDITTIQHLANIIWPAAYKNIISTEQISYMLELIYSTAALTKQIEAGHQFIFAVENDKPIGFASFSQKSKEEPNLYRLHKIYVLPKQSIKGIGSFMLSYLSDESKIAGASFLQLNVNKNNSAILFYEKKGFVILKEEVINIGNGYVMDDYVMSKKL